MVNIPKISAVIITFNQEKVIGRAIDSILQQEVGLHEIVIADDCSTDNNWKIVEEYQKKYPEIIKPYRHEKNLGIFGNLESTWDRPTGDLIIYVSGDDAIADGLFRKVVEYTNKNEIDFKKGSFCIYSDSKSVNPKGEEKLRSNKLISKGYNAVSLKIRGLIGSGRGVFYSQELLCRFKPVKDKIGIYSDGLFDVQVQLYSDNNYYVRFVGGIYYSGIGIASKTPRNEALVSLVNLYQRFYDDLVLDFQDRSYLQYQMNRILFIMEPNIKNFIFTWYYSLLSIKIKYGGNVLNRIFQFSKMFFMLFINKKFK